MATIAVPQRKNGAIKRIDEPRAKGLGGLIVIRIGGKKSLDSSD
jgi:hypothetical protein